MAALGHRRAIAGRPPAREAEALFERYVAQRGLRLPPTFREALDQLDERLDSAPIPQARLDWAWSLRGDAQPTASTGSAARAGAIWWIIYCSTGSNAARTASKGHAAAGRTGHRRTVLRAAAGGGGPGVVATAHVGPMYAGLMALELLGIPSRWLATAPRIARSSYAAALISTADQTGAQVAKACMRALASGHVQLPGRGRRGQSRRAARILRGTGSDVFRFSRPIWRIARACRRCSMRLAGERQGGLHAGAAAAATPGEDADAYALRWRQAYFEHLRAHGRSAGEPAPERRHLASCAGRGSIRAALSESP